MIQVGDKIPNGNVYVMEDNKPVKKNLHDLCKGKKVVIFGLPGAFTPVCTTQQVPQYYDKLKEFEKRGVDGVFCMSVNDAFVMHKWAESLGVNEAQLPMLADGDASWHEQCGLTQHLEGLGTRARRYSMVVDDLVITNLNAEEEGGTCYRVSDPEKMLECL